MEKLKLHSPDFTQANIAKLAELFPNCVTETQADDGKLTRAIDFDQLRQELSTSIVDGPQERYQLNWPGKREALLTANAPIAKTLRPCRDESVDFDTTQNLFIEGDNLDALKLLQETYLNKVKMIYIDPPYNTGNDFIYEDDFALDIDEYYERSSQKDQMGNRLVANTEANGRFHSDWLSMIYSRLKLSRNLLTDDGVIFISIDDNEIGNLRKVCDEIFGEQCFIANFIWEKRITRENRKVVSNRHDHLLCYTKDSLILERALNLLPMTEEAMDRYKNPDNDPRGVWTSVPAIAQAGHGTKSQFYKLTTPAGRQIEPPSGSCWRYTEPKMNEAIADNKIWFGSDGNGVPRIKKFIFEGQQGLTPESLWWARDVGTNDTAKRELTKLFDEVAVFDTPKPHQFVMRMIKLATDQQSIVLDFFSGSAPTAQAVFQQNIEDGGERKFILVQLPEACDEKSEAFKAGYKSIAEIAKERIRRSGKKIKAEVTENPPQLSLTPTIQRERELDVGFRVLKIDSSNMKDVYYAPDAVQQVDLLAQVDNIREDRTPEDLLFQVLLDWGVDLALPITHETIVGKQVFFVDGNALAACFETGINEEFVKALAARHPLRAVFRDAGFGSDSVKINIEQIFKLISPTTDVKSI